MTAASDRQTAWREVEQAARGALGAAGPPLSPNSLGFGFWLSPTGRLRPVSPWTGWEMAWFVDEPDGLVLPDPRLDGDDRYRIPLLERGWVELRTRTRADARATIFTPEAAAVVAVIAEVFLTHGRSVRVELVGGSEARTLKARGDAEADSFADRFRMLADLSCRRPKPRLRW